MAKYTIISDVGKALTNILRDKLVPEPIDKPEKIGICEPKDRGNFIVGIHPYDIQEDLTSQKKPPIKLPDGQEMDPPSLMELYYMISVSSKSEIEVRSAEESRIIGKIIQVFKDNQSIPSKYLESNSTIESIPISMIPLEMEEKVKIWTMFGESYKLSVFYLVGPVAIDSEVIRKPKLVETVILGSVQRIPRKIVQFETRIKEEDIDDEYTQDYQKDEEEEDNLDEEDEESESSDSDEDEESTDDNESESDDENLDESIDDLLGELDGDKDDKKSENKEEKSDDESIDDLLDELDGDKDDKKSENKEKKSDDESIDNLLDELDSDKDDKKSEDKKEKSDDESVDDLLDELDSDKGEDDKK